MKRVSLGVMCVLRLTPISMSLESGNCWYNAMLQFSDIATYILDNASVFNKAGGKRVTRVLLLVEMNR